MTWLSRLLPQAPARKHSSAPLHRTAKQRRRMMTLENLEQRVVLSDVSAVYAAGVLTINSDISSTKPGPPAIFGNAFNIVESSAASGGTVTVSPASLNTTINGFANQVFVTPGPVASIFVTITGTSPSNSETVNLTGPGKTTPTTVKDVTFTVNTANLTLNVNGVDNSGPLTVTEGGTSPGLTASIDNSHFSALTITQPPQCCTGVVEIGNTTVDGNVLVRLGNADASSITIQGGSHLGSTILSQGNGNNDKINIVNSYLQDVSATQGNGNNDGINIDTVVISAVGKGVTTTQGNGNNDTTTINKVTLDLASGNNNFGGLPLPSLPSIKVTQGNGTSDIAKVTASVVTGDITITQGNGFTDQASILGSSAGTVVDLSAIGLGMVQLNGNMNITQGDGYSDTAKVDGSTANKVNVKQGNGGADNAQVTNSTVNGSITVTQGDGSVVPAKTATGGVTALVNNVDGTIVDPVKGTALTGGISVTQGNGNSSTATVSNADAVGSVSITQGNGNSDSATITNVDPFNVSITQGNGNSDVAKIDTVVATNNVSITQGNGNSDAATINAATAGGAITITQGSGNSDTATVSNSKALTPGGGPSLGNASSNIVITQGGGDKDTATITGSRADGNLTITQGDGTLDLATISNSTAGFVIPIAPGLVFDWQGDATITQGDGNGDVANFTGLTVNNVEATQGDNIFNAALCAPGTYDQVNVNNSTITSDITITQGSGEGAQGNYIATIADGTFDAGFNPIAAPGNVTAGGNTVIEQLGTGNVVVLGTASTKFSTFFLDVFTGFGGSFVWVTNTTVVMGAQGLFGTTTINASGPGLGDTYISGGGNSGVTVSPDFNS